MASGGAWGRKEDTSAPPPVDLNDIMSEEVAKNMQHRENVKYATAMASALPPSSSSTDDEIPPELLLQLERERVTEFCDSDEIIAQMLQCQFDQEYGDLVKMSGMKRNGLYKYKMVLEHSAREPEDETEMRESGDWDEFETNERNLSDIPRCGYAFRDGKVVTKHDAAMTNKRNASRVMEFPPEFQTGDGAAFDMKLPNKVYNSLKAHSRSESKKNKMLNRKEAHATAELGIDEPTRLLLYKLVNNEMLLGIDGVIATGKESVVLHSQCNPSFPDKLLPDECAIKIFKTTLNEFKTRDKYIKDDYRFKDRFHKLNPRKVIHMWAEKEMHNLMRLQKIGIDCPDVILLKKHILVLSFIGENHKAALKLKDVTMSPEHWHQVYENIIGDVKKMYTEANLIHADLSEYNILWHNKKHWFIDVSQSIEPSHPCALEFLLRDCTNISNFFTKKEINPKSPEELFEYVTGIQGKDLAILERLRHKGNSSQKIIQEAPEEPEEGAKAQPYPFDYAWEKSKTDKVSKFKDSFVHHDGVRDDFDELWKKTREKARNSESSTSE